MPSAVPVNPVLHLSILILTKLKRWVTNVESTRPKTTEKNVVDAADIEWSIIWLADKDLMKYRDQFADKENLMVKLKAVLSDDWHLLHTNVPSHRHDGDVTS